MADEFIDANFIDRLDLRRIYDGIFFQSCFI